MRYQPLNLIFNAYEAFITYNFYYCLNYRYLFMQVRIYLSQKMDLKIEELQNSLDYKFNNINIQLKRSERFESDMNNRLTSIESGLNALIKVAEKFP